MTNKFGVHNREERILDKYFGRFVVIHFDGNGESGKITKIDYAQGYFTLNPYIASIYNKSGKLKYSLIEDELGRKVTIPQGIRVNETSLGNLENFCLYLNRQEKFASTKRQKESLQNSKKPNNSK